MIKNSLAGFFRILFRFPYFKRKYFGFYKRLFIPFGLFRGVEKHAGLGNNITIRADLGEWIQQQIYFFGVWDARTTGFLTQNVKPGDVFIDIGANIGYFSLLVSELTGNEGTVHAFEPVHRVADRFSENISRNGIKNIRLNRKAVYSRTGTIKLYLSSPENMGMSSIHHHDKETGEVQEASSVSLDEYAEEFGITRVDFIKIDIEGSEAEALKGMAATLQKYKPILIMEVNAGTAEPLKFLQQLGYRQKCILPGGILGDNIGDGEGYTNYVFIPEGRIPR